MTAPTELGTEEKMRRAAEGPKAKANGKPKPKSPYGDAPTFTYQPKDGGELIIFPTADVLWEEVDGVKPIKFLWRVRKLNEPYQTFAFLERAKVPDDIVERALDLPDEERQELFRRWFAEVTEPPEAGLPGES
jgi:hypothetical protein